MVVCVEVDVVLCQNGRVNVIGMLVVVNELWLLR